MALSIRLMVILFSAVLLTACFNRQTHQLPYVSRTTKGVLSGAAGGAALGSLGGGITAPIGAAVGGLAGSMVGHDLERRRTKVEMVEDRLTQLGASFVRLGEDHTIVIPAERLFYNNAPSFKPEAGRILDLVAEYIKFFPVVLIKVNGFTNPSISGKRDTVLSRYQAQNVMRYLSEQKIDARMIVASGYGSSSPIASNRTKLGQMTNRRIEVSFRMLPLPQKENVKIQI